LSKLKEVIENATPSLYGYEEKISFDNFMDLLTYFLPKNGLILKGSFA